MQCIVQCEFLSQELTAASIKRSQGLSVVWEGHE